jgi:hypothetical protein
MEFLGLSFRGLRYYDVLLRLGGWWGWLREFGEELAENTPFAELGEQRIAASLAELPKYFLSPRAVGLALPCEGELVEPMALYHTRLPGERRRKNCENAVVEVRLRDFSVEKIAAATKELVGELSGGEVVERRGKGKRSEINSLLDALSAMRLACWYPRTVPRRSFLCGGASAVSRFGDIRLGRIEPGKARRKLSGELSETNFERCAARGRREFERMFPFGERAANALTWAQRRRRKRVV